MTSQTNSPTFTRRHWGREAKTACLFLFSPWTSKARGARLGLSNLRITVTLFAVLFAKHWPPGPWGAWDWATLCTILAALPFEALLSMVPAKESLLALTAIANSITAKRTGNAG